MTGRNHALTLCRALTPAISASSYEPTTPSSFPSKTIMRSNFDSSLQSLRPHVKVADFVAIDLEMTGVANAPRRESFKFDRYDVNYLKVKDSAIVVVLSFSFRRYGEQTLPLGASYPWSLEEPGLRESQDLLARPGLQTR
ncbi:hypothetical protein MLD38_021581 [Melastoma candidum]|uniref:Uncharacterized protein n=1 Tax=Melastoma candidum TaxID=119954 RepID=A0ACB9QHG8_9MYRT|nr:hypothetical protein MLD38_021581 [Melastoma candidum]